MATYFTRYYLEFTDAHPYSPVSWRVEILDSEGNAPTEPFRLECAANPLVTRHIDTEEDKFTPIIGREITIGYLYKGNPNEPLPDLFFEATERRFRAIVYRDGVVDGTYYIKPDFSSYPDQAAPFAVYLKAVDGLSYASGTSFNAYDETGLLFYEKTTIYDILVTRGLYQIFDPGTVVNVLCSLKPVGYDPNYLLTDNYVHTDMFYDFVSGPLSVKDVILAFCKAFNARLITEKNEIWFIRVQDLNYPTYEFERYIDAETVELYSPTDFVLQAGSATNNDAIPINISGTFSPRPALKKAEFEVEYKSINQLSNFDWSEWDGSSFADWTEAGAGVDVDRVGSGTAEDPYKLFLSYPQPSGGVLQQLTDLGAANIGDIIEFEIRFRFNNVKVFEMRLDVVAAGGDPNVYTLNVSGDWTPGADPVSRDGLRMTRSGKKQDGSFKIKSKPIPRSVPGVNPQTGPFIVRMRFTAIMEAADLVDGNKPDPEPDGVTIWPVKLGVIDTIDIGKHITVTNPAQFSRVREVEKFNFIDTREDGLSNTIFTGSPTTFPGGWDSDKPGVVPGDIERQMAIAYIDQYQRSVMTWQGTMQSNSLGFINVLELTHRPGKKWMMLQRTYNNGTCDNDVLIAEVFEEYSAEFDQQQNYLEYDIEEAKND